MYVVSVLVEIYFNLYRIFSNRTDISKWKLETNCPFSCFKPIRSKFKFVFSFKISLDIAFCKKISDFCNFMLSKLHAYWRIHNLKSSFFLHTFFLDIFSPITYFYKSVYFKSAAHRVLDNPKSSKDKKARDLSTTHSKISKRKEIIFMLIFNH